MRPHEQRVVDEAYELLTKLDKLRKFIFGDSIPDPVPTDEKQLLDYINGGVFKTLPVAEQSRLLKQMGIMEQYARVLRERIDAFHD
jgi:hypothetical protein